jgi:hypothetical protein
MKQPEERRIYVAVAGTIQVPVVPDSHKPPLRTVVQPIGRQVAQACHAVSMLRFDDGSGPAHPGSFQPMTTIVLQARDSAEMGHVFMLLIRRHLRPVIFSDNNPEYGPGDWPTAVAVFATKKQISGILDYLPTWGAK